MAGVRSSARLIPLLLLGLSACEKEPVIEVIPGVDSSLEVVLVNPTQCPRCDAFEGVDTLRIEVSVGGDVVASDNFAWPGEAVTLPDLSSFGVVRVSLLGLADGRVLSAGRTAEIVLLTDATLSVPLVFVPANRALPLAAGMLDDRYLPGLILRRSGAVVVAGGLDPLRQRALVGVEAYDLVSGTFVEADPLPVSGFAAPAVTPLPDGETLLAGGYAVVGDGEVPVESALVFDDATGLFTEIGEMSQGRVDHCVAMFRDRQGVVFGGAPGAGDYLKVDPDVGGWAFSSLVVRDLDSSAVSGCATTEEGTVFVQGSDAASTGVWSESVSTDPSEAWRPIAEGASGDFRYVEGAALVPSGDGGMFVLGGADSATGEVYADGRHFSVDNNRFESVVGFVRPRFAPQLAPWIEAGWYAAGCGWASADRAEGEPSVELVSPGTDEGSPAFQLDRDREGCGLAVLPDGSVLLVGGGPAGVPDGSSAALLVPWLDTVAGG